MKKFSKEPFKRVFDSKDKGGCESVVWEALENMFLQRLISRIVPVRFEYSKAVEGSEDYLRRHAI